MSMKVRAHVIINGRVQGVFFRMETKREADSLGVSGWVRNRRDGTVEAIFEGDESIVKSMLDWCKKGPRLSNVKNVDLEWQEYKGEFDSFDITY